MDKLKAVVFDVDNTLVDRRKTFILFCEYFIDKYAREYPYSCNKGELINYMVQIDGDGYGGIRNFIPKLQLIWELPFTIDEFINERNAVFGKFSVPMPGLNEVLPELKKKYKLGIITNGYSKVQRDKIDAVGIAEYFDDILVSQEAACAKPDKGIFELSLAKLKVKPEEAIYIGDYYPNDIEGAVNAKIKPIWITEKPDEHSEYNGIQIRDLKELLELL